MKNEDTLIGYQKCRKTYKKKSFFALESRDVTVPTPQSFDPAKVNCDIGRRKHWSFSDRRGFRTPMAHFTYQELILTPFRIGLTHPTECAPARFLAHRG